MIDKVLSYLSTGQYWLASTVLVLSIVVNLEKVSSILERHKTKRLLFLKEAVADDALPDNLKPHLHDEVSIEYFYRIHGVRMDKFKRDLVLDAYNNSRGEITFGQFVKANGHLEVEDGKLKVCLTIFDKLFFWYNAIAGSFLMLSGALLLAFSWVSGVPKILGLFTSMIAGTIFVASGIFVISQVFPILSAKKIEKHIRK
ncbi:hypothetical protein MHM93_01390 [Pseudoalteromonas sp. MM17-2]|uniref:hypothetical protein n=1 Tax=Pseudoalteromonas sp. MM17-2 TaxID=2917753 RepID=UPI001EF6C4C9|nr:hypothetical protein [Pseudoalteromonas sp. MM17-2]MCG7542832.1 hypothetical protein [Pseudoalteromonas sp. MM17-2]